MALIISLSDARQYVGKTNSEHDAILTRFIEAVGREFENHCCRALIAESVTEYHDGNAGRSLYLNQPAETITTIHLDGTRTWGASTLVSASDYLHHKGIDGSGSRVEYLDNYWTRGQSNIRVVYVAGFATIPYAVTQAARVEVGRMYSEWERAKEAKDNVAAMNVEGWSIKFLAKTGIDDGARQLLKVYRRCGGL